MNLRNELKLMDADGRIASMLNGKPMRERVEILCAADVAAGIVKYPKNLGKCYLFQSKKGGPYFTVHWNELRSLRPQVLVLTLDCPICLLTIQKKALQHWFTFNLNGSTVTCLANPFPYMEKALTLATVEHESQDISALAHEAKMRVFKNIVLDLCAIASALPTFTVIYNGTGAGASLAHKHYQAFELPKGHGPLAIEQAAAKLDPRSEATLLTLGVKEDYPLIAFRVNGDEMSMANNVATLFEKWAAIQGETATLNLVALTKADKVVVYFVPRNKAFENAAGFAGAIGSVETCGTFICSTEWELRALSEGKFSYCHLWRVLGAVRPPAALDLH